MWTTNVSYTDFNGAERTEKLHFHMSESEFVEFDVQFPGGFVEYVRSLGIETDDDGKAKITEDTQNAKLFALFKDLIVVSYGEKSEDGRYFRKDEGKLGKQFMESAAYSAFFVKLTTNEAYAASFVKGVLPSGTNAAEDAETLRKLREK